MKSHLLTVKETAGLFPRCQGLLEVLIIPVKTGTSYIVDVTAVLNS